jgi:hypothetical protein
VSISDLDIYRSAHALIKQDGDDTAIHAAMKADKFLEGRDLDGAALWKRIVLAINELQTKKPPAGTAVH